MNERADDRIRVLIVDDSAVVRRDLATVLAADPELEVVGAAIDPYVARSKILSLRPDLLLLGLGLPRMDGLTFLKLLMEHQPVPVIVVSSLVTPGADRAIEALEAGAADVFARTNGPLSAASWGADLIGKIKVSARAFRRQSPPAVDEIESPEAKPTLVVPRVIGVPDDGQDPVAGQGGNRSRSWNSSCFHRRQVVLMGASTGGTEALKSVLTQLPAEMPPICVVQHIPPVFSRSFADRLNELCALEVREAVDGDELYEGLVLVAPGGFHMELVWKGGGYRVRLHQGPERHFQRPAVDVLFESGVKAAGDRAVVVLLTGMGKDGASGMKNLRDAGAHTIAQDRESCVVYGMPMAAVELNAATEIASLADMPRKICNAVARQGVVKLEA